MDKNPNKVTVLTAGGANKKNKKNKKKQHQQQHQQQPSASKPNDVALSSSAAAAATAAAVTMTTTLTAAAAAPNQEQAQNNLPSAPSSLGTVGSLEYHIDEEENIHGNEHGSNSNDPSSLSHRPYSDNPTSTQRSSTLQGSPTNATTTTAAAAAASSSSTASTSQFMWLFICFFGIMASFVIYGLLLEYATSGGRTLHELSFLFITSGLYTLTAAAGRYVRDETPTTIAPSRFAILGLTSMGSTFFSVRSLRYVVL